MPCRVHTSLEVASRGLRLNKVKKLSLLEDKEKGRGVCAEEEIVKGEFVCEYKYTTSYPRKQWALMEEGYKANGEGCYVMDVVAGGKKLCIDATVNLNSWGRYINHAPQREANVKQYRPLLIRDKWRVAFLATRDIHAGEELSFDYGQERDIPEWMRRRKVID